MHSATKDQPRAAESHTPCTQSSCGLILPLRSPRRHCLARAPPRRSRDPTSTSGASRESRNVAALTTAAAVQAPLACVCVVAGSHHVRVHVSCVWIELAPPSRVAPPPPPAPRAVAPSTAPVALPLSNFKHYSCTGHMKQKETAKNVEAKDKQAHITVASMH